MDLALIGNCSFQALIDRQGSVQWLCWPRFDSSFVFGGLLDKDRGGEFSVRPKEDEFETEQAYLPNTNILRTVFKSASGSFELIDFAPRFRQFERSFKPNMLVRRLRRLSGDPRVRVTIRPVYDYGRLKLRGYTASNHIQWQLPDSTLRLTANVPLSYVNEGRPFLLERDAYFVTTWGEHLEASLIETCESFLNRTQAYWERWVKHTALPGVLEAEVIRSALALKLHQFEDTGAITAAATTSLPESDGSGRNWDYRYCWIRDAYFTLRAMRRLGQFEELEAFVNFMKNLAGNVDNLQPVYGISGAPDLDESVIEDLDGYLGNKPVRIGNAAYKHRQHDVYGEMIAAIAPLFLDRRFETSDAGSGLRLVRRLLDQIEETMELPDTGIWALGAEPRVHTFSLLMHWTGAEVAARIGNRAGDPKLLAKAVRLATRARELIEACFLPQQGFYADAFGGKNADASLFMMINLGFLKPDNTTTRTHLRRLAERLRVRDHLLHRYVPHDGLSDAQNTFTVCGFWYAEALARLGDKHAALDNCTALLGHANHVGLFSADIDPRTGEQWGNFPQTYSHVGLINAAFAINPVQTELGDI